LSAHDYDLLVIGAGSGGLSSAILAPKLGKKASVGVDDTGLGTLVPDFELRHKAQLAPNRSPAPSSRAAVASGLQIPGVGLPGPAGGSGFQESRSLITFNSSSRSMGLGTKPFGGGRCFRVLMNFWKSSGFPP